MLQALLRTITEILDSKKATYSFIAALGASVLHLYFGVEIQDALLLVSPLAVATVSEAHVDAAKAKNWLGPIEGLERSATATVTAVSAIPADQLRADQRDQRD